MAKQGKYIYDWPRPMVTVDAVVFAFFDGKTNLLLIKRKNEPFKNEWALPGDFIEMDEDLQTAAARELQEETCLKNVHLTQLHTFGKLGRDPRGRLITVAFMGIATEGLSDIKPADDAAQAKWFDIENLPKNLAFDHDEMIKYGIEKLEQL